MKHTGKIIFLQEILSIKYFIENVEIIQKIGIRKYRYFVSNIGNEYA